MTTITVRYAFCPKHSDRHMVDEHERHIGNDPHDLTAQGYFFIRHIGGGWYAWREPVTAAALPLDWQMAIEDHNDALAMMTEPDF
jgi:hypothetical protein